MSDFLNEVLANTAADAISWIAILILVGVISLSRYMRQRLRFRRILNLDETRNVVRIYFSSLFIEPGTVKDLDGNVTRFGGPAISAYEFRTVTEIDRWLSPLIRKSTIFEFLLDLAPDRFQVKPVQVEYLPSPHILAELNIQNSTTLFVGGPLHNLGTKLYYDENATIMRVENWNSSVKVVRGKHVGKTFGLKRRVTEAQKETWQHPDYDYSVLERVWDEERNATVLIVAGTGSNGTRAALHYLINSDISTYRDSDFAICFECPSWLKDRQGFLKGNVVFRIPL